MKGIARTVSTSPGPALLPRDLVFVTQGTLTLMSPDSSHTQAFTP